MDELKAWAENQVGLWTLQTESLTGGKMRVEELDGRIWTDITPRVTAQLKDDIAKLRSILGRIDANISVDPEPGAPGPSVEGLD